jgi:DTW domain-containing protein YfiP
MVYDLYFEEEMKRGDCFISDEVSTIVLELFGAEASDSNIDKLYRTFKESKTVQKGLIYSRIIPEIKVINGVKNGKNR